jgi:peptidoglycan/LPS O-acetylase OafA/YrhL
LRYLGRISYGIYLYHMLTPALLSRLDGLPVLWRFAGSSNSIGFAMHLAVTVTAAAASYHLLEMPVRLATARHL